jgi:hypothetical protein
LKTPVLQLLAEKGYQICDKKTQQPCEILDEALLGKGAFGSTYLNFNPLEALYYAVKVVDLVIAASKHNMSEEKLQKEVRVMMKLFHPHIVKYYPARWVLAPTPSLPHAHISKSTHTR